MFTPLEVDLEEFDACCADFLCPACGLPMKRSRIHPPPGRRKIFCSDACRYRFWKKTPNRTKWNSYSMQICPVCGKPFYAQHENKRVRKYCSRACSNKGRAMDRHTDKEQD